MSERVYFLDASALVFRYLKSSGTQSRVVRGRLNRLFAEAARSPKSCELQVPNICMAECAKAFARLCFEENLYGKGDEAVRAYRTLRESLLTDVQEDRILHSWELNRRHFVDIEDIFQRDHQLPSPRSGGWLSSHDALIISMAKDFSAQKDLSLDRVIIVSCDRRIVEFCRQCRNDFPRAADPSISDLI